MSVIYAMSDIHGCYPAMKQALAGVHLKTTDQLIFVGDYVDGGPNSFQVLSEIMTLERNNPGQIVTLLGNHDEWLCNWLFPKDDAEGRQATIVDFKTVTSFFNEVELQRMAQALQLTEHTPRVLDDLLREKLLQNGRAEKVLSWLKQKMTAQRYYELENQIFVHAGIDEETGHFWKQGTLNSTFTEKFPATKGSFFKDIVSGHIHSEEVANDSTYLGAVYWDGDSHFFVDGHTDTSGIVPILKYDTETGHYTAFKRSENGWEAYRLK
ncbi:metallophosphoesterase [Levilactobacillus enshiensis]|uniref:metallophosphoesterase n=1 Tax=Levilactobacillus enshiensis TaxID=2590213 RepID=UPI00131DEF67|nr:metallophosphoesterase [Levilactobacillus enshiensis]